MSRTPIMRKSARKCGVLTMKFHLRYLTLGYGVVWVVYLLITQVRL